VDAIDRLGPLKVEKRPVLGIFFLLQLARRDANKKRMKAFDIVKEIIFLNFIISPIEAHR